MNNPVVEVAFDLISLQTLLELPPGSEIIGASIKPGLYRNVLWLRIANADLPESADGKEAELNYIRIESEFVIR